MTTQGTSRVAFRVDPEVWREAGDQLGRASPDVDRSALMRMALDWARRDPAGAVATLYAGSIGAPVPASGRRLTASEVEEWYAAWRAAGASAPPRLYGPDGPGEAASVAPEPPRRGGRAAAVAPEGADGG